MEPIQLPANERDLLDGDDSIELQELPPAQHIPELSEKAAANPDLEGDYLERGAQAILGGLRTAGEGYARYVEAPMERYIKAPIRAGLKAGMEAPMGKGGEQFVQGAIQQLGKEPLQAPSGRQIAEQAGFTSEEFETPLKTVTGTPLKTSGAQLAAGALDIATDPIAVGSAVIPNQFLVTGAAKALGTIGRPLAAAGREIEQMAASRALRQATGRNIQQMRSYLGAGTQRPPSIPQLDQRMLEMGTRLRQEPGLMGSFSSSEAIGRRVPAAVEKYTKEMARIGNAVDATGAWSVNMPAVADELREFAFRLPDVEQYVPLKASIEKHADKLEQMGGVSFKEAQQIKNAYKYKPQDTDAVISNQDFSNFVDSRIAKQMDDTISQIDQFNQAEISSGKPAVTDSELLKQWREAKKGYAAMIETQKATSKDYIKDMTLRTVKPSTYLTSMPLLAQIVEKGANIEPLQLAMATAIPAVNQLGIKYGNAFIAKNAGRIADFIKKSGQAGEKYKRVLGRFAVHGPQAIMVTHYGLREADPEYRELTNELRLEE